MKFFKPLTVEQMKEKRADEYQRRLYEAEMSLIAAQQGVTYYKAQLAYLTKGVKK